MFTRRTVLRLRGSKDEYEAASKQAGQPGKRFCPWPAAAFNLWTEIVTNASGLGRESKEQVTRWFQARFFQAPIFRLLFGQTLRRGTRSRAAKNIWKNSFLSFFARSMYKLFPGARVDVTRGRSFFYLVEEEWRETSANNGRNQTFVSSSVFSAHLRDFLASIRSRKKGFSDNEDGCTVRRWTRSHFAEERVCQENRDLNASSRPLLFLPTTRQPQTNLYTVIDDFPLDSRVRLVRLFASNIQCSRSAAPR